jgi:hypothetical protein
MTIDKPIPTSHAGSPTLAPLEGSKQCPYCAADRWVPADAPSVSNELSLLSHFLGVWERHEGSQS